MSEPILSVRNLVKAFRRPDRRQQCELDVAPGEVVGLLGDNGAGKSTLIKCISGVHPADDGEIFFDGQRSRSPARSTRAATGIETIYQDLALANNLDVGANIFLGREVKKRRLGGLIQTLDDRHMREQSRQTLDSLQIRFPTLTAADREPLRRPAPGGRDRPRRLLGRPADDHGRADQQPRRPRAAEGARAHPHARDQGVPVILITHILPDVLPSPTA